jgi:hypothetical protein
MSEPKITKAHHGGANHGQNGAVFNVVIHDEEFPLADDSAEKIADYFSGPKHGASCAHYVADADSEQHCVPDGQIAYHAPPNKGTIGIERDGYASWSKADWLKPRAQKTTCRVAARTAELCVRHKLPPIWLGPAEVKAGKKGVTSHANRSKAFGQSTHSDPGPAFPVNPFMDLVKMAYHVLGDQGRLKAFQKSKGLVVDGDAGSKTLEAMTNWLYNSVSIIAPNKSAPIVAAPQPVVAKPAPAPVDLPDTWDENGMDFRAFYRRAGAKGPAYVATTDGCRVFVDGPWYRELVAKGLSTGTIIYLPADSAFFSLPLKGADAPGS